MEEKTVPAGRDNAQQLEQLLKKLTHLTKNDDNVFLMFIEVFKKCQRVVALADMENVPLQPSELKNLLYKLFELETIFSEEFTNDVK